jgi:hypothetical protein
LKKNRNVYKNLGVNERIVVKWALKQNGRVWSGFIWLKLEISGRLLPTQQ